MLYSSLLLALSPSAARTTAMAHHRLHCLFCLSGSSVSRMLLFSFCYLPTFLLAACCKHRTQHALQFQAGTGADLCWRLLSTGGRAGHGMAKLIFWTFTLRCDYWLCGRRFSASICRFFLFTFVPASLTTCSACLLSICAAC